MATEDDIQRTPPADLGGQGQGQDSRVTSVSGWATTDVAAKALGVSPRSVRRFIDRGELEGRKAREGIVEAWEVSIDSLYALRDKRVAEGQVRRDVPRMAAESSVAADITDMLRDLTAELVRTSSEAAEYRIRLELTERTESSLREENERLRAELEAERGKSIWQRLFGR